MGQLNDAGPTTSGRCPRRHIHPDVRIQLRHAAGPIGAPAWHHLDAGERHQFALCVQQSNGRGIRTGINVDRRDVTQPETASLRRMCLVPPLKLTCARVNAAAAPWISHDARSAAEASDRAQSEGNGNKPGSALSTPTAVRRRVHCRARIDEHQAHGEQAIETETPAARGLVNHDPVQPAHVPADPISLRSRRLPQAG